MPTGAGVDRVYLKWGAWVETGEMFIWWLMRQRGTMSDIQPKHGQRLLKLKGEDGVSSGKRKLKGERGLDLVYKVPVGTSVCDVKGRQLMDLNREGDMVQVAKGGQGGSPNNDFQSQKGSFGTFKLLLKLIADVGLVGFPNAGKSTLLSQLSDAKPSITAFPFTTLHPNVGHIRYGDLRKISVADTPGLIEGAHENIGLGHRFLKHVERTKVLAYVTDVNGFQLNQTSPNRSGYETLLLLMKELELYDASLLFKPGILLLNKVEDLQSHEEADFIIESLSSKFVPESIKEFEPFSFPDFTEVVKVSAKEKLGLDKVAELFREELDKVALEEVEGGLSLTAEEKQERLAFDLTHGLVS
ncbi:GTP-binding protein 10-like isoform X2 [Convolutriloba macropyga]|uniref:GTP-binding protein 10-like isoform X2 n=1 Tax=Convolutriloba macropyga TaxID=536237 RepID=UPI003F524C5D